MKSISFYYFEFVFFSNISESDSLKFQNQRRSIMARKKDKLRRLIK